MKKTKKVRHSLTQFIKFTSSLMHVQTATPILPFCCHIFYSCYNNNNNNNNVVSFAIDKMQLRWTQEKRNEIDRVYFLAKLYRYYP